MQGDSFCTYFVFLFLIQHNSVGQTWTELRAGCCTDIALYRPTVSFVVS